MKRQLLIFVFITIAIFETRAQQTVGLFKNSTQAFDGYTLFAPIGSNETYLIDNCGEKVHSWTSDYLPGLSCYLLEDGTLLRTGRSQGMGGSGGIVEMIDWDSNVIWDYSSESTYGRQHHDIAYLPNGNILLIVHDLRSQEEVEQAGSTTTNESITSEQIIEIQPDLETGETTVVWEWKAWDHIIQDADSEKPNYGVIGDHPEKIDVNFVSFSNPDWLHINSVEYHEEFDQIILSVHRFGEFWIIDHSTSTNEAAGSTGGNYEKGGDLLYRWGNPLAYDQGTEDDQKLFFQHHTHWIPEPLKDAGKIIMFNNQAGNPEGLDYSTINIVETPVNPNGSYRYNGAAYEPNDFDWTYKAPNPTDFYSKNISGVQRLENGNTLICEGAGGRLFELDENEDIVWEYVNPISRTGPITQNIPAENNNVFRCTRYAPDYPGFNGKSLVPQGYLEIGSTFSCELFNSDCNPADIFANESTNAVCFEESDPVRKCYSNSIPGHDYGPFDGMDTLKAKDLEYSMCLFPELGSSATEIIEDPDDPDCGDGIIFGVSLQGINFSPFAPLYWVNPMTMEENLAWHIEANSVFNMDLNGGHLNDANRYHYHDIPLDYFVNDLNIDGSDHSPVVGYAADGFPIYYKYLYTDPDDPEVGISPFESSYAIKSGMRQGDGVSAPDGPYDGNYWEDYEYIPALSALDECGMRFGITPEYPDGTYYYVLTDNWPYIPRCLKGKYVDHSFRMGPDCQESTAFDDCSVISVVDDHQALNVEILIFPNPANGQINISLKDLASPDQIRTIDIYNLTAELVYQSDGFNEVIYLDHLSKGIYFIRFDLGHSQVIKKLIIQ